MFRMRLSLLTRSKMAAILDLLKQLISPARLNRFRPNFAGYRNEAIDMFRMSFNFWTYVQDEGTAAILALPKPVISAKRLNQYLPNLAACCSESMDMFRMSFNIWTRSNMAARRRHLGFTKTCNISSTAWPISVLVCYPTPRWPRMHLLLVLLLC